MSPQHPIQDNPQEELQALSPTLASWQVRHVWQVPEGYFRNLPDRVLQAAHSVPEDYFATLPGKVLNRIHAIESEVEDPVLPISTSKLPYSVPEGYFPTVAPRVQAAIKPAAVVIPLWRRIRVWGAVAATIAAAILALVVFSTKNDTTPDIAETQALPTEDLIVYLTDHLTAQDEEWLTASLPAELSITILDSTQSNYMEEMLLQELTIDELEEALL